MFGWDAPYNLVIGGLDTTMKYDLYIPAYYPNENGCKGQYSTANLTASPSTCYVDNGGPDGNDDTWVEGSNYVRFVELVPDANSNVTINIVGLSGCRAMVSGIQLVTVVPEPATLCLAGLLGALALLRKRG